jgi:DNA-directed RNA polymerase subunit L
VTEQIAEQAIRLVSDQPDRARVEIKENAKGEPQVSVRLTGDDPDAVAREAVRLLRVAHEEIARQLNREEGWWVFGTTRK